MPMQPNPTLMRAMALRAPSAPLPGPQSATPQAPMGGGAMPPSPVGLPPPQPGVGAMPGPMPQAPQRLMMPRMPSGPMPGPQGY